MAKSVGLSHQDMYHPDVSAHIDNHLNGDGTSSLGEPSLVQASHPQAPQRPQTSQGYDATRSVAPPIVDKGSANPLGAHKPEFGSIASQNVGPNIEASVNAGSNVGIVAGRSPRASAGAGLVAAATLPAVGDVIGGVARDIYHETDNSPEAAQRAQSRIRK